MLFLVPSSLIEELEIIPASTIYSDFVGES